MDQEFIPDPNLMKEEQQISFLYYLRLKRNNNFLRQTIKLIFIYYLETLLHHLKLYKYKILD